jgi:hypothetical protein
MALSVRIQPISRELELMMAQDLGPKARSAMLAAYAAEAIEEAKQQNKQILGAVPPYEVYVDGNAGAPLTSVQPDGVIRAEFELVNEALAWINTQLQMHSPVLTGLYAKSHELYADGSETEPNNPAPAEEYAFVNIQPYARKIERGLSKQAPDGVYQAVATLAQKRFGNLARVTFSYRQVLGGERNPAIIVKLRG